MKENYVTRKQAPFMNKTVRKVILVRAQLLNKFRTENSFINKLAYKRQRNFLLHLLIIQKRTFIISLT